MSEETVADDELVVRESGGADLLPGDSSISLTGDGPSARAVESHTVQAVPGLAELPRESAHRRLHGDCPAPVAVVPLVDDTLTQSDVVTVTDISEVTIRNRYQELLEAEHDRPTGDSESPLAA